MERREQWFFSTLSVTGSMMSIDVHNRFFLLIFLRTAHHSRGRYADAEDRQAVVSDGLDEVMLFTAMYKVAVFGRRFSWWLTFDDNHMARYTAPHVTHGVMPVLLCRPVLVVGSFFRNFLISSTHPIPPPNCFGIAPYARPSCVDAVGCGIIFKNQYLIILWHPRTTSGMRDA